MGNQPGSTASRIGMVQNHWYSLVEGCLSDIACKWSTTSRARAQRLRYVFQNPQLLTATGWCESWVSRLRLPIVLWKECRAGVKHRSFCTYQHSLTSSEHVTLRFCPSCHHRLPEWRCEGVCLEWVCSISRQPKSLRTLTSYDVSFVDPHFHESPPAQVTWLDEWCVETCCEAPNPLHKHAIPLYVDLGNVRMSDSLKTTQPNWVYLAWLMISPCLRACRSANGQTDSGNGILYIW